MQMKNHKALDRMDQSSKRLTPHTYTKETWKEKKQLEGGRMEDNHHEIRD